MLHGVEQSQASPSLLSKQTPPSSRADGDMLVSKSAGRCLEPVEKAVRGRE